MEITLENKLRDIGLEFLGPYKDCKLIIDEIYKDMIDKRTVKMLDTFISYKEETRYGEYLVLDFGGSNIRISLYEINDDIKLKNIKKFKLRGEDFDYTTNKYSLSDIFDMVAIEMEKIIEKDKEYLLAHTFSFAIDSVSKNEATILEFSKGFNLSNAIGVDINKCLEESISKRGLKVRPIVVLNDTVASLVYGCFRKGNTKMACIVGTGHNMCFIDSNNEIINMESGCFNNDIVPLTKYDRDFLDKIPEEKMFLMEALIGGKNSALLCKTVIDTLSLGGYIKPVINVDSKMMSLIIENDLEQLDKQQNTALREVSKILYKRSAYLIACEILSVIKYLGIKEGVYNVVFDGTVYEKTPYLGKCLTEVLEDLLPKDIKITHELLKDASSIGGAIICSMEK